MTLGSPRVDVHAVARIRDALKGARAVRAARIVARNDFETELQQRCASFARNPAVADSAVQAGGFTLLLVRLRRSDRRLRLLTAEDDDPVLREALLRTAEALHEEDLVTDCGRDEIAVLLVRVTQEAVARLAVDRVLRALTRPSDGVSLRPQVGVAIAPVAGATPEQLLCAADIACEAAANAHPTIAFAVAEMVDHDDAVDLPAVQQALRVNTLDLAFQPQFDLRDGTWTTIEALIRWPRTDGAPMLSPARVVDIAERYGLMDELTQLVLNTTMRQVTDFDRQGVRFEVAINLSPSMMTDPSLPDRVAQALATWGLPAERLVLEVTENAIIRDGQLTLAVMHRLAALGARLSIDDFGTGHSSLARLRDMPLAELKIDRLFVASMTTRREDLQIVRSMIDLAHNFDLRAVAEGVEDESTFAMLSEMGCDAIQGYYCARPMAADALLRWWPQRSPALPARS